MTRNILPTDSPDIKPQKMPKIPKQISGRQSTSDGFMAKGKAMGGIKPIAKKK